MEALPALTYCELVIEPCPENPMANPEATEASVKRQELGKEEAKAATVGSLEDRHMARHLNVQRRQDPKKRTQRNSGFRQKLAADPRRMIRRAVPVL
jgi:hypothetical protein